MALLVYNLTTSPLTLAAGNPAPVLPASANAGARGAAVNVTGELSSLSSGNYALLQAQVDAGSVQYEWSGLPEFNVYTLVVGSAQTDVSDSPIDIYVDSATGNDANPGTAIAPFQTLAKALSVLPVEWKRTAHINLALGEYAMTGANRFGTPNGPLACPLILIGTPTVVKTLTDSSGGSNNVITDSLANMIVDEHVGAEVLCTSGDNAGQAILIRRNTATTVTLNGLFLAPIGIGDTFEIRRPGAEIITSGATSIQGSMFALAHVKLTGAFDFARCQITATRNVEFSLTGNLNIPGTLGSFTGMNIGGIFNNDPTAPFGFFSFQSGAHVNSATGFRTMLISASALRISWLVARNISLACEGCASPRIHGLAMLDSSLGVYTNTYLELVPNGIFGFLPSAFDNTQVYIASSRADIIGAEINNSPTDAIVSDNATVWVFDTTGTGNDGYGLAAVNMGQIFAIGDVTVTGNAGEVLVGAESKAYSELPFSEVDASGPTLCRVQN